jgi:hypothetical protein
MVGEGPPSTSLLITARKAVGGRPSPTMTTGAIDASLARAVGITQKHEDTIKVLPEFLRQMTGENGSEAFAACLVRFVEPREQRTVEVEHAEQFVRREQRHHQLGA